MSSTQNGANTDGTAPSMIPCLPASLTDLRNEVISTLVFMVLGFLFTAVPLKVSRCPARRGKAAPVQRAEVLAGMPHDISAEIARCLPLGDLAAVSATSDASWARFGLSAQAWRLRAADSKLDIGSSSPKAAVAAPRAHGSCESREAFRRALHGIDAPKLLELDRGYTDVMADAATLLRGLLPRDGQSTVDAVCDAAERCLQAHNPASKEATAVARQLLQVADKRINLLGVNKVERLENAYHSALHLQALMDVSLDNDIYGLDALSDRSEVSGAGTPPNPSPRLPEVGPCDEDMLEMQRQCELDRLLEELQQHDRQTSSSEQEVWN